LQLPDSIEDNKKSLFYSCATVNPRMYKRTIIKYLLCGVNYYFVAVRWVKALITSPTFKNEVAVHMVPCTLAGSAGSLPLALFCINNKQHIKMIVKELTDSLVNDRLTVIKKNLVRTTRNSTSSHGINTIGEYKCNEFNDDTRVSIPTILNAWRNDVLFTGVQDKVNVFMDRENAVVALPSTPNIVSRKIVCGIKNTHQNCWLSSLVQMLKATFAHASPNKVSCSLNERYHDMLIRLFVALTGDSNDSKSAVNDTMKSLLDVYGQPSGGEQQDPSELLLKTLSENQESCFYVNLIKQGVCWECKEVMFIKNEFFLTQQVYISDFNKLTPLTELLEAMLEQEIDDYKCSDLYGSTKCSHSKIRVKATYAKTPEMFVVSFAFNCVETANSTQIRNFAGKISQAVSIPYDLNGLYNLNSMVLTNATQTGSGHYIALVHYDDPEGWYLINDEKVIRLDGAPFDGDGNFNTLLLPKNKSNYGGFCPLIVSFVSKQPGGGEQGQINKSKRSLRSSGTTPKK
jgi:hypothetical protein